MPQKQVGLRLDPELLARVEKVRGDVPRNKWIERAVERALGETPRERGAGSSAKASDSIALAGQDVDPSAGDSASPRAVHPASALLPYSGPRACERCSKPYTSPTLRRCNVCNGKILPEPE